MPVMLICEMCKTVIGDVGYRLTAVHGDAPERVVIGHRYFHWKCLKRYMREA